MNPISAMVSDGALIAAARAGSGDAFCQLVERHQSLACAVAYSHCGRQAPSEDLAQEAFLAAWRDLASLREPDRFRGWLAGIVRNLARAWNRRAAARPSGGDLDPDLLPSAEPDPEATVSEREEEELVWKALASMPETYREPLVLFHREGEAVAAVAAKLELSEDAVKQRLSRGRALLKERVSDLVERSLRRTRPSATFTLRVLAAWSSMMALAGSATAGPATLAAGFGAKGAAGAAAGATAWGAAVGLASAVPPLVAANFGFRAAAAADPDDPAAARFRAYAWRALVGVVVWAVAYFAVVFGCMPAQDASAKSLAFAHVCFWMALPIYQAIVLGILATTVRQLPPGAPDPGFVEYASAATLRGVPLFHLNFTTSAAVASPVRQLRVAHGWIAVGDVAKGILAGFGGIARGLIAVGGVAYGGVVFGGVGFGFLSLAGAAVGAISLGGLAIGALLAHGGAAIGGYAFGGLAVGIEAKGGLAVAWHAAYGGKAIAREIAFGGVATATHANDDVAKAYWSSHWADVWSDAVMRGMMILSYASWSLILLPIIMLAKQRRALANARPPNPN